MLWPVADPLTDSIAQRKIAILQKIIQKHGEQRQIVNRYLSFQKGSITKFLYF